MADALTGRVIYPNDPGWDAARHGFAARFDYDGNQPLAVVFAHYGVNVARLRQIKKQYDSDNFFSYPQGIPPA